MACRWSSYEIWAHESDVYLSCTEAAKCENTTVVAIWSGGALRKTESMRTDFGDAAEFAIALKMAANSIIVHDGQVKNFEEGYKHHLAVIDDLKAPVF